LYFDHFFFFIFSFFSQIHHRTSIITKPKPAILIHKSNSSNLQLQLINQRTLPHCNSARAAPPRVTAASLTKAQAAPSPCPAPPPRTQLTNFVRGALELQPKLPSPSFYLTAATPLCFFDLRRYSPAPIHATPPLHPHGP
jgi:hypothetical protein